MFSDMKILDASLKLAKMSEDLKIGDFVVATVRRPFGHSIYDTIGQQDFTTDHEYWERGISRLHGYWSEFYVEDFEFLIKIPQKIAEVAVLLEPLSIIEKGLKQAEDIQKRLDIWQPKTAAVLGTGNVGLLTVLALRLRGFEVHGFGLQEPEGYVNADLLQGNRCDLRFDRNTFRQRFGRKIRRIRSDL